MENTEKTRLARRLFVDEIVDYGVYHRLAEIERDGGLKILLGRLARMEKAHMHLWAEIAGISDGNTEKIPFIARLRIYAFLLARKLLGVAFITKLISRNEKLTLEKYNSAISRMKLTPKERKQINTIIHDERYNETDLNSRIKEYRGQLNYIGSIVFGLNDGLVEILAAVSGIAVIATTSTVVVVSGFIIGIAGTLSMAAGAYLSAKSHGLVQEEIEEVDDLSPRQGALYCGTYYFLGALISIIPFIFGLSGYTGILSAIILVSIVLTTASIIIAVVSGTSIRKRILEMLAISLGVVLATVILGTIARVYFGVVI